MSCSISQKDALEFLKELSPSSVDLIIADPPYNLNKDYGNESDKVARNEWMSFVENWLIECDRVLKPTGSIYIFMGFRNISKIFGMLEEVLGYEFRNWICWHYTQGIGKTKGFSPRHDDILYFSKTDDVVFNLDSVRIPQKFFRLRNNMRGANPGDVWSFSHVHYCNKNRFNHPTQKPEGLIERMVLASSNPGDVVIDTFLGSGTTARVCQQLGREFFGCDLNSEYVNMAKERLTRPFDGFDSIDLRMERVPLDLRDPAIRKEYIKNHIDWFLMNHKNARKDLASSYASLYGKDEIYNLFFARTEKEKTDSHQPDLFTSA